MKMKFMKRKYSKISNQISSIEDVEVRNFHNNVLLRVLERKQLIAESKAILRYLNPFRTGPEPVRDRITLTSFLKVFKKREVGNAEFIELTSIQRERYLTN